MLWFVFILLSAVLLAAYVLMIRRDLMHDPNTQVLAIYPLIGLIILPFIAHFAGESIDFGIIFTGGGLLLLIKTASVAISLYCTTLALERLPLSVVGPVRNLNPLFVAILGFLLLSESLSLLNILGLVIIVGGMILLDVNIRHLKDLRELKKHLKNPATFLILLAAFVISFSPLMDRLLLVQTNLFTIMFYYLAIFALLFWGVHFIKTGKLATQGLSLHEVLWILLTGVMLLFADLLYYLAMSFPAVSVAVIIGVRRLSNLFVTIFGGAVLHEKHGFYKGVVCSLMILGTVLLVL